MRDSRHSLRPAGSGETRPNRAITSLHLVPTGTAPSTRRDRVARRRSGSGRVGIARALSSATQIEEDPLAASRGIVVAFALALICWLVIGVAILLAVS
jgi:hypothetical protein